MALVLRNCGWIYTCNDQDQVIADGFIRIEGGCIAEVGSEPYRGPPAEEDIDLAGAIVLPGFVNVHHHFFQSLTKAVPPGTRATSLDWLFQMYPIWACYDAESFSVACELAAAELLLSGATTSADHSYFHPRLGSESLEAQVDAVRRCGLRLHLVRGSLATIEGNLATRLGEVMGSDVSRLMDEVPGVLSATEAAIRRYHDTSIGALLRIDMGPTGVTYAKPEFMRANADMAAKYGCNLHTHYHPRKLERDLSRQLLGKEPLDFLRDAGWVGPHTWMAHSTELTDQEIEAFAGAGVGVAHCPHTIIRLGYQITPVARIRRSGVTVGIGVDGAASNDRSSMITEMRLALLLHRAFSPTDVDPAHDWLDTTDVLAMATRDGARILRRTEIGSLKAGQRADVAAFDLQSIHYAGAIADPLAALLLSGCDSRAKLTIVEGKVLVRDGRLTRIDEHALVDRANTAACRVLHRAVERYPNAIVPSLHGHTRLGGRNDPKRLR